MNLSSLFLLPATLTFSLLAVPLASSLATYLELVDHPSARKRHVGEVPLAGGMVLVSGLWFAFFFIPKSNTVWAVVLLSVPLFLLGAIDDKFDLSAKFRLLAQLLVGLSLLFLGVSIYSLDSLFADSVIVLLPVASVIFTLICSCGVLNAINMADGIDGLLGSISSISLLGIAWLAFNANAESEASLSLATVGLLCGYLAYNLGVFGPDKRIFLGDSGSMVVGLVLLVLLVQLSQGKNPAITPTSAGWLLGVPLLDTVSVMIRRVADGRSPFVAGRDHFHHVLQDLGISRRLTLRLLIAAQLSFVLTGIFANHKSIPQYVFFWFFVLITVAQYFCVSLAVKHIGHGKLTEHGIQTNRLDEVKT